MPLLFQLQLIMLIKEKEMAKMPNNKDNYFIMVNNTKVEVSKEVYNEYTKSLGKEAYQIRKARNNLSLDFDLFGDSNNKVELEIVLKQYREQQTTEELKYSLEKLFKAIKLLKPQEQELITALFFNGETQTSYSQRTGIPQQTVSRKLAKTLAKLKKSLNH